LPIQIRQRHTWAVQLRSMKNHADKFRVETASLSKAPTTCPPGTARELLGQRASCKISSDTEPSGSITAKFSAGDRHEQSSFSFVGSDSISPKLFRISCHSQTNEGSKRKVCRKEQDYNRIVRRQDTQSAARINSFVVVRPAARLNLFLSCLVS
jgi:hypothetical protein